MSSLYRRATPTQARILRIVEGAIKNASDAHPRLVISPHQRRSIAKRAAGTLSAQWVGVLAAKPLPVSDEATGTIARRRSSNRVKATVAGRAELSEPAPLGRVERHIYRNMRAIKRDESADYARAMIDVLRLIAKARAGPLDDGANERHTRPNDDPIRP